LFCLRKAHYNVVLFRFALRGCVAVFTVHTPLSCNSSPVRKLCRYAEQPETISRFVYAHSDDGFVSFLTLAWVWFVDVPRAPACRCSSLMEALRYARRRLGTINCFRFCALIEILVCFHFTLNVDLMVCESPQLLPTLRHYRNSTIELCVCWCAGFNVSFAFITIFVLFRLLAWIDGL
jgi:hypothetical protein